MNIECGSSDGWMDDTNSITTCHALWDLLYITALNHSNLITQNTKILKFMFSLKAHVCRRGMWRLKGGSILHVWTRKSTVLLEGSVTIYRLCPLR